jgi:polyhydroxyalkanoate synthesis repressor PhaR
MTTSLPAICLSLEHCVCLLSYQGHDKALRQAYCIAKDLCLQRNRALSWQGDQTTGTTQEWMVRMTKAVPPTVIKKYANRRLYHTGTSTYVTLEDLAGMVKKGEEFLVTDAKTGEDITRSVLTQIIFELEGQEGQQTMLPVAFLRQLIGLYGDQMQGLVPSYLEHSMQHFAKEQQQFKDHVTKAMSGDVLGAMQDQARTNMTLFQEAFRMFNPYAAVAGGVTSSTADRSPSGNQGSDRQPAGGRGAGGDVDAIKQELDLMRQRLDQLARKETGKG